MILVVVDGRQADSDGMTLPQLTARMVAYYAFTAMNLDGGGSWTMVAARRNGESVVLNPPRPVRDHRQRACGREPRRMLP